MYKFCPRMYLCNQWLQIVSGAEAMSKPTFSQEEGTTSSDQSYKNLSPSLTKFFKL